MGFCPVGFCPSGVLSQWSFVLHSEKTQHIDGRTMKEVKINAEIHKAITEF